MNLKRWKSPSTTSGADVLEFHYPRLRSVNGIRLVSLKSGSGNKGVAIELFDSFVHGPNQQAHTEYDALSYTWGDGAQEKSIICNGKRLKVTETLIEALKHFRHPDRDRVLWIDQICICQDRILERNQQVQMMGKIFKGARKVTVWLGGHYDDSKAGMQLAEQLLSICRQHPEGLDMSHLESYGLPKRGHRRCKALAAVLRRPWFWRTWIVQEVVLNPNVELVLGDSSLKWEELEAIIALLEGPAPRRWQVDLTMSAWELPFARINRIRLRHQKTQRTSSITSAHAIITESIDSAEPTTTLEDAQDRDDLDLLDLLLLSRDLGATDPRDKVYALLGLTNHEMIPDYTSSPEQIFNEFALHIIGEVTNSPSKAKGSHHVPSKSREVRKALILLSCAGKPNQTRDLPSWTPDWSATLLYRPLIFDARFCAGGDVMEMDWDHETGCLQLCGKLVDTVAFAGSMRLDFDVFSDPHSAIDQWWTESKRIASWRAVRSPGSTANVDAFDALRRDLFICDHGYFKGEQTEAVGQYRPRRRGSLLDELDHGAETVHDAQQTLTLGPTRGRVMCVTTTGYLALAPHGTREGDLIYVILGAGVPSVLRRRSDDALTLIGEAYVQGIMSGEFLEMDQLGPVEDISIR